MWVLVLATSLCEASYSNRAPNWGSDPGLAVSSSSNSKTSHSSQTSNREAPRYESGPAIQQQDRRQQQDREAPRYESGPAIQQQDRRQQQDREAPRYKSGPASRARYSAPSPRNSESSPCTSNSESSPRTSYSAPSHRVAPTLHSSYSAPSHRTSYNAPSPRTRSSAPSTGSSASSPNTSGASSPATPNPSRQFSSTTQRPSTSESETGGIGAGGIVGIIIGVLLCLVATYFVIRWKLKNMKRKELEADVHQPDLKYATDRRKSTKHARESTHSPTWTKPGNSPKSKLTKIYWPAE